MPTQLHGKYRRTGFTLLEITLVVVVLGVVASIAMPRLSLATIAHRVNQAANVVVADLELANALAAQRRIPLELRVDSTARGLTLVMRDSARVVRQRALGAESEWKIESVVATPARVVLFPGGTTSSAFQVVLRSGGHNRTVTMSRAGLVRVLP
jgi:type II secretion system protein H